MAVAALQAGRKISCAKCPMRGKEVLRDFTETELAFVAEFKSGELNVESGTNILLQGANSAIVDATVLAAELAADRPLPEALARYTARRRPAVAWVQDTADRLARLSRVSHPALRWGRDVALRCLGRLATGPRRQQRLQQEDPAWLYATARTLHEQGRPPTLRG